MKKKLTKKKAAKKLPARRAAKKRASHRRIPEQPTTARSQAESESDDRAVACECEGVEHAPHAPGYEAATSGEAEGAAIPCCDEAADGGHAPDCSRNPQMIAANAVPKEN